MSARLAAAASVLALSAAAALAQGTGPGTPQGAADLTATFQTYFGSVPGAVNVVPDSKGYVVTLDATPVFARIPAEAGVTVSMTPYRMVLADNGDGTWNVVQDQPVAFTLSIPGMMEVRIAAPDVWCKGTFDAAIRDFSENECKISDLVILQTVTDPLGQTSTTRTAYANFDFEMTSRANPGGGVNQTLDFTAIAIEQDMMVPMAPGEAPVPVRLAIDRYDGDATITGYRVQAVLDVVAWLVANPDPDQMTAARGQLRDVLAGGLPIWEMIDLGLVGSGMTLDIPIGPVTADEIELSVAMSGAVEDGLFGQTIAVVGLQLPPGVVPPYLEPLLPMDGLIDFTILGFDAAGAARVLLGLLDLPPGAEPGPEFDRQFMSATLPGGSLDFVFGAGLLGNRSYEIEWEGRMTAGPGDVPTGAGRVTMLGFDETMELVDTLPQEMKDQALPFMGMARGIARVQEDGSLLWEIDASRPGTLKINGMDLMGMQ